jgi:hypothetical protein
MSDRPLESDVDLEKVGRYRSLREVEERLRSLGARVTVEGETHEGRDIHRVELGSPRAKKVSLVISGLHAMEWIGVESALAIADDWIARGVHALGDRRLVILPVQNPDGYAKVERELRAGKRRFTRANARGVDLNRNFATHFRPRHFWPTLFPFLGGPGPEPGSEPETRVILGTLERERGRIDRVVSLHSFGNKLLLPYGGRWKPPHDIDELRAMAREVNRGLGGRYDVRASSRWLPGAFAYGMELDHFHAEGISPLLVECSTGGFEWSDPSSWVSPFRWFNPRDPEIQSREIATALRSFLEPVGSIAN